MTHKINLHQHVKIWLSKEPDVFLPLINQRRLIKQRYANPKDTIHLVYDARLLSPKAQKDLDDFCAKYKIEPINVETINVKPDEKGLLDAYHLEISNLKSGGNPAPASDILRWLSAIYTKGIYTDFDIKVDTSKLPETITINAPILLDGGSMSFGSMELACLNNHIIGVSENPDPDLIRAIQNNIVRTYNTRDHYAICSNVYNELIQNCSDNSDLCTYLTSARNTLKFINQLDQTVKNPCELRQNLKRFDHVKTQVLMSTGPSMVTLSLFDTIIKTPQDVDKEVAPFVLSSYGLRDAFKTFNTVGLHDTKFNIYLNAFLCVIQGKGGLNDLSWLAQGEARFFKKNKHLMEKAKYYSRETHTNILHIREEIENHIKKIQSDLNGNFFGWYRTSQRYEKIAELTAALQCFHGDNFDALKYREFILTRTAKKTSDISAGYFYSSTQNLLDRLEKESKRAYIYGDFGPETEDSLKSVNQPLRGN